MIKGSATAVISAVKHLASLLAGIDYALMGSANLYLQGMDVVPRDIDILTTPEGIRAIDERLSACRTRKIYFDESEGRNSFRSFYDYEGVEVEALGNVANAHRSPDALARKTFVDVEGARVPALTLTEEAAAYRSMGREEKARLIEEYIASY